MAKTYLQVQQQIAQLQAQAESLRKKEAAGVLARIKEAIAVYGFTAEDLGVAGHNASTKAAGPGGRAKISKAKTRSTASIPKYRDGNGNVWGGRGPRPAWFKAALESGKTPAELAV
ncbi:DNA-binding protein H-NS [Variovorax sp. YR266]|nr:DNA-binding protein H-NS [Variovorax sp. YR266]